MGMFKVKDPGFNHFDFLWGIDAPELVYQKLLDLLDLNNGHIRLPSKKFVNLYSYIQNFY